MAEMAPDTRYAPPTPLVCGPRRDGFDPPLRPGRGSAGDARFRALVENAFEALWLFTADGTVTYASPANEQFFGRKPDMVEGRAGSVLVHPEDRETWLGTLNEALRRPGEIVVGQFRVPHEDGSWRWVETRVRNLLDHPGVEAIVASARDITRRREAEEEIRRLNADLEDRVAARTAELAATNRELEAFSYSVSHDLRAPLRTMRGFSKILLEDHSHRLDALGRSCVERLAHSAEHMEELIAGLLELSGVTRASMSRARVDLTAMARSISAELRERDPGRVVTFTIEEGISVDGDPRLLRAVLENLLGNAWKYTVRKPVAHIHFGTLQLDGHTVHFVRDDGAGFDMEHADQLFGVFQRLHRSSEFEGSGIGLATVQRIIHRHGGRVWGEGEVGRGATFYFTVE